ncbi:MAG: serine hydrolase domain-containing protein [Gemmatimonadota bacterium]
MFRRTSRSLILVAFVASLGAGTAESQETWPDPGWTQITDLEGAGWSPDGLAEARSLADSLGTAAYLVVEDGRIVDSYGDVTYRYRTHSVRKSLLSALYGVAAGQGPLPLDATLAELGIDDYAELSDSEHRATLRHLLQSRSGVYLPAAYENEAYDEVRPARGSHGTGDHWFYSNWDFNAAGTAYQLVTGNDIFTAFRDELADPLEMDDYDLDDTEWRYETRSWHPAYLFRMSSRDLARLGLLYLREGRWKDRQIVPGEWVRRTTAPVSEATYPDGRPLPGACYGWMWWVPCPESPEAQAPFGAGMFEAVGTGEQVLSVLPAHELVFVHRTDTDLPSSEFRSVSHSEVESILGRILEAKRAPIVGQWDSEPRVRHRDTPSAPDRPDSALVLPNPEGPYQVGTATRELLAERT